MWLERLRHDNWAPLGQLIALVVGVAWILLCSTKQWFFYDEWAFLVPRSDSNLFEPHVGHWSTTPMLITEFLRDTLGMGSYWPYLLFAIAAHVLIAEMLWIILRRIGVQPWIAVGLFFLFLVLGLGAENILWAFQVGFMGAVALGLVVVVLVDDPRRRLPVWKTVVAIVISVFSLTFSGTALPVVFAGFLVSWRRRGFLRSLPLFAPSVVVYLIWFVITAKLYPATSGGGSRLFTQLTVGVPQYMGHMFVDSLQLLTPLPMMGIVIFVMLLLFVASRPRRMWTEHTLALALASAGVAFALLTAYSRGVGGDQYSSSSRYAYLVVAFLLPTIGLVLTWAVGSRRTVLSAALVLVLLTAGYNAALLRQAAGQQATTEQNTRGIIYAAIDILHAAPSTFSDSTWPEPVWAPDLRVSDLKQMVAKGYISAGLYSPSQKLTALLNMGVQSTPAQGSRFEDCKAVSSTIYLTRDAVLKADTATQVAASFNTATVPSQNRTLNVAEGYNDISFDEARSQADGKLRLDLPGTVRFELCSAPSTSQ
jgi:hypothetical protein